MGKGLFISLLSLLVLCSGAAADMVARRNGTVTDLTTGLTWQQAEAGAMTWTEAVDYCENLSLANQDDWRLPSCVELQSIVDYSRRDPSINTAVFPGTMSAGYWSSTPYTLQSGVAWVVDFVDGDVTYGLKSYRLYVRAVRGEQ
ncbi:MAG: DUF1566 domain-containing protein [Pseudomonadota bacterium]